MNPDRMRLARFTIRNYRCFEELTFEPHARLSLLVGGNGAGKSSLLDAIVLPADLLRLAYHPNRILGGWERGGRIPGGASFELAELAFNRSVPMGWTIRVEDGARVLEWELEVHPPASRLFLDIARERIVERTGDGERVLAERDHTGARALVTSEGGAPADSHVPYGPTGHHPLLRAVNPALHPELDALRRFVEGWALVRPVPALMREDNAPLLTNLDEPDLPDRYGRDLTARLHALLTRDRRRVDEFLDLCRLLFAVDDVIVEQRSTERIRAHFVEVPGGPRLPLAVASDGQLVAFYLALLATPPPADLTLLLLDEPAMAVARPRGDLVGDLLRGIRARVQVVAVTHSRELVDEVGAWETTWLLERRPGGASRIRRLDEVRGVRHYDGLPAGTVAEDIWRLEEE